MSDNNYLYKKKDIFLKEIHRVAAETGFKPEMIEKDYYLSLLLYDINNLDLNHEAILEYPGGKIYLYYKEPVFKGGTCLNKLYYGYYRLSEDLDFSIMATIDKEQQQLYTGKITPGIRANSIKSITKSLPALTAKYDMIFKEVGDSDNKRQKVWYLKYKSLIAPAGTGEIKLDIGMWANIHMLPDEKPINHKFHGPFNNEELIAITDTIKSGKVKCFHILEIGAEKLRASATRGTHDPDPQKTGIAPRDFVDIQYMLNQGFNFKDRAVLEMFKIKGFEDGKDWLGLAGYAENLGRTKQDIEICQSRIEPKLSNVLTQKELKNFDLTATLQNFNRIFKELSNDTDYADLNKPESLEEYNERNKQNTTVKVTDNFIAVKKQPVFHKNDNMVKEPEAKYEYRDPKVKIEEMKNNIKDIKIKTKNKSRGKEMEL